MLPIAADVKTNALAAAEAELNDRVYRLFALTLDEIKLLQHEVEHGARRPRSRRSGEAEVYRGGRGGLGPGMSRE